MFSFNQVCRHMHTPRTLHLSAVERILRYLKCTPVHGLLLGKGNLNLTTYSDSNWAGCAIDRCSTIDYCIFFGQNLVSSSTESDRSLAYTSTEIFSICSLVKEIYSYLDKHPLILYDNTNVIALTSNCIFHVRTKHIKIDYHYICDLVTSNIISIFYISSQSQLADLFTNSLPKAIFKNF